jgi:hypothetical protein
MKPIPVIVCLDVEPDEREIDRNAKENWRGFEETSRFFIDLRPQLERATGAPVKFSWFFRMDPQIERIYRKPGWVVSRYGDVIKELEMAGDEIGLHTHAWRWDEARQRWISDYGDQTWVNHCVQTSFEAYTKALGRPCLAFRFGDHWMNNETMSLLESLGVRFDLTIEPGRKKKPGLFQEELQTGSLPDYRNTPRQPYRPSRQDYRKPTRNGARDLWAIPVSTGREEVSRASRLAVLKRAAAALGIPRRGEPSTLNLSLRASQFSNIMNRLLDVQRVQYLAPSVRTDVCADQTSKANLEENVAFILSHPQVDRLAFVTPAEAIELLA